MSLYIYYVYINIYEYLSIIPNYGKQDRLDLVIFILLLVRLYINEITKIKRDLTEYSIYRIILLLMSNTPYQLL